MRTLTLTLPGIPPPLNVLMRMHHYRQRATTTEWAELTALIVASERAAKRWDGRPFERATLTLAYWFPDRRRRDPDGAIGGAKGIIDGMVRAGLLPDDDFEHLALTVQKAGVDKLNPRIAITVEEIAAEEVS